MNANTQKKKKMALIATVVLFCLSLISAALSYYVQTSIRCFEKNGVWDTLRIIEFREVSSGPAPHTRTIAIAESIKPKKSTLEIILASHILMGQAEVSALLIGQSLRAITLPDTELPHTMLPYEHWFVTEACLQRHLSSPFRAIGVVMPLSFLLLALLLGIFGLRKKDQSPSDPIT